MRRRNSRRIHKQDFAKAECMFVAFKMKLTMIASYRLFFSVVCQPWPSRVKLINCLKSFASNAFQD